MKNLYLAIIGLAFITAPSSSFGDNNVCIVSSFSEFGNTKTCFKNLTLPTEAFKEVCEPINDEYVKTKTSYAAACPPKYKGVCRGLKTQSGQALPYISYLYENDMEFMQATCTKNGGKWESGDQ